MYRVVSVVGARPQFIKLKPIHTALQDADVEHIILHTGQHYDPVMSDKIFDQLHLPRPDVNLGIEPGLPAQQLALMIPAIEQKVLEIKPDAALIYGDTTTTLAAAVALSKLALRFGHVEAGMRSGEPGMLEEVARRVADRVSSVLFAPTQTAVNNLKREGLEHKTNLVGDVMLDLFKSVESLVERARTAEKMDLSSDYALMTLHRAENVDHPHRLEEILRNLSEIAEELQIVFPLHPRTQKRVEEFQLQDHLSRMKVVPPQNYLETLSLIRDARLVITDSGGLQKEAFFSGTRCITIREKTEWPETLTSQANLLAPLARGIRSLVHDIISKPINEKWSVEAFGDGKASFKIREVLLAPQN